MYKVMLVDDEKLILDGLQKIINWDKYNLEIASVARNGKDAIEQFLKTPVDIIITDINMPIKTGLELVEDIKKIDENVKLIILSGYDEFSYAKKAISLGVEAYILKPIDEQELENVLEKIILEFEKTNHRPLKTMPVRTNLNRELSYKRLENLVEIKLATDTQINCYFIITVLTHNNDIDFSKVIKFIITQYTEKIVTLFEIVYENSNKIHIINYCNQYVTLEQVEAFASYIVGHFVSIYKIPLFVALSKPIQEIDQLADEIKYLTKAIRFVLIYGFDKIMTKKEYDMVKKQPIDAAKHMLHINNLIMDNQVQGIEEYINSLFDIQQLTPENIDELSAKILILIDDIFQEFNLWECYKKQDLIYSITTLYNQDNIEDIKYILLDELKKIAGFMHTGSAKYNPVVKQALRIIQKQYDENLTLKILAQSCNINSSYLGQLFYKEVGESFSEFLNKVRNERAKELILTTDMKISDIAEKIGYRDTSYFYRKFKKYHGICPSTLRQIKN